MTEQEAIAKAINPTALIDERDINEILMFLNGKITDLDLQRFEQELVASQKRVNLLKDKEKTVALAEAEFKISGEYKIWQQTLHRLRQFRAYRYDLRNREKQFMESSQYTKREYGNYKRVI